MYLFEYTNKNVPVNYQGNALDSLLELKYILSVEESHIWLRSDLVLHYKLTADYLDTPWNQYTPDFLVRNVKTNKARLIEVKPDGYDDAQKLRQYREICANHIKYFQYDWEYEVIYESSIHLSPDQERKFQEIVSGNEKADGWCPHLLQNNICTSDEEYRSLVINGIKPTAVSPFYQSLRRSI